MPCNKPAALLLALAALAFAPRQRRSRRRSSRSRTSPRSPGWRSTSSSRRPSSFSTGQPTKLIDPDAGLIRFEDWAQAKPVQKQFLSPYPSYVEPMVEITVDGVRKRFKEKLHMYVAAARFALARAPDTIDLASLVTLPFIERIDPAIKHRLITSAEAVSPKDPRAVHNQHPLRRWCEARPLAICIHSRYQFEGKLPLGIQIANKIRERLEAAIADYLEFESELTLRSPAEVDRDGACVPDRARHSAGRRARADHLLRQPGDAVRQASGGLPAAIPSDANQTVVTVFMALGVESSLLGKKKEYSKVPVLRNLVPAQVLAGKSSFNTGNSISAGLPVYARNQVKAIAAILEKK